MKLTIYIHVLCLKHFPIFIVIENASASAQSITIGSQECTLFYKTNHMHDQLRLRRHVKFLFANKLTTAWEKEKKTQKINK